MDGKITDNSLLAGKALAAGEMEVYGKNNPKAIRLYGKQAANGVLIFTGAVLVDKTYEPDEVDVKPLFPGGPSAWREYLSKVLDADLPSKNNAPPGRYTVSIYFIVDKNGNIKDIAPITKLGYGMEEEVMRVIKTGPDWIPALVDGEKVMSSVRQKFTFQVLKNKDQVRSGNLSDTELIAVLSGIK
jgi:protein TonB